LRTNRDHLRPARHRLDLRTSEGVNQNAMKNSRNQKHLTERLKDLQAYRQTLIHRQNETGVKLSKVETEIRQLKEASNG